MTRNNKKQVERVAKVIEKIQTSRIKVRREVYINAVQAKKLRELSLATRVPQAEYVREGVGLVLNKYERVITMGGDT